MITNKGFYLLRAPLMPVDFLTRFLTLPITVLADEIRQLFSKPYMAEAIYIASPELSNELRKWQQDLLTDEKAIHKLTLSLLRYILRMSTRCTPYGLFAGCATGTFSERTAVHINSIDQHRRSCRLDMNYVAELADTITHIPAIREQLLFYPNNSLYRTGDSYRYAAFTVKNKFRQYDLTAVRYSGYLERLLNKAANGATICTLCEHITDADISVEEAREFILEIIDSQLLVSELEPTITGEEFFSLLINRLQQLEDTTTLHQTLVSIQELLDTTTPGIEKYLQTHRLVRELLPATNNKDLVQTDLFLSAMSNTISEHIIQEIQDQMHSLWKLSATSKHPDLLQFCKAFSERYEEQSVPLSIALDTETGIGYGVYNSHFAAHAPLLDDIVINNAKAPDNITWNKMKNFRLNRYISCIQKQETEIELTDEDINDLATGDTTPIPASFYMMGSIVSESASAIDNGNYLFDFASCGGPSAANLLARFCHGDTILKDKIKACLDEEAAGNPDVIFAEIIHLPEARTGNILMRPQLRDYEIVYLGNGSVPADQQLPITDLLVSVEQNNIILRSHKLNKRVIPRLSTAHNFSSGSLPVYKFLCDLQFQQLRYATGWQWDLPIETSFLPRVRYKKFILQKCSWTIRSKEHPSLSKSDGIRAHMDIFKAIRDKLRLPRYVAITERDNELFIDLDNALCVHLLVDTLLKKEQITLQEVLQTPDKCWLTGQDGRFTNEVIIPFKSTPQTLTTGAHTQMQLPQRHFQPGSEWLYVKIYAGINTSEKILTTVIGPLIESLQERALIDKWFFIRYTDPEDHIRIRFHHTTNKAFWKTVLEELHERINREMDTTLIRKIQTDTYIREIERYGVGTMELSENIFYYDSEAVLGIINLLEGEAGEQYRWLLAIRGVDMLLEDLCYSLRAKTAFLKRLQVHFFREFGSSPALQTQLNNSYRNHMRDIASFLDQQQDAVNGIEEAIALLEIRSSRIKQQVQNIPVDKRDDLTSSYIHMFLNRMLSSNQRKHELVIYHFLSKYYDSKLAIEKQLIGQHPRTGG